MSISTALSRVTGFVRTWAMAVALGLTLTASSYTISNNIPNMIYELLAGGVLSSMLVPIILEKLQADGQENTFRFANNLFCVALVILGVVAFVATLFPQPFVWTQTFATTAANRELAIYLFRFFAVQIVFYGYCAITTGILTSYRKFLAPALAPIANNIVVIVVLLGVYIPLKDSHPDIAIVALAAGTTLAVVALFVFQLPSLFKLGFRFHWRLDLSDPSLRKLARKTGPILVFVIVNLVGVSFRNAFALQTDLGGPAALSYAWMWYQLPYGVLAVAYFTALFPELSEMADRKDWLNYKSAFARGLRVMSLLILPMAAMLIALAVPLVSLYRAGAFSAASIPQVALVLQIWAVGLFAFSSYMLTLRAFYSMQDSVTPMYTNFAATVVQIILYWFFTGPARLGLAGIPLAEAIYLTIHWTMLLVILRRRVGSFGGRHILWTYARVALASVAGGAAAYGVSVLAARIGAHALSSILQLLLGGSAGLVVAYGAAALMRVDEIADARRMLDRVVGRLRTPKAAA